MLRTARGDADMKDPKSPGRRQFIKVCAGAGIAVAADPGLMARPAGELRPGEPVRLVDSGGMTLRPADLAVGESYVFHYPYVTTPCFLIDLGVQAEPGAELETADGRSYRWSGGVGPGRSIVAFSAICAHRMSYPTRAVTFIDYRHEPLPGAGSSPRARGQVIYCCSEGSVYDPQDGGRVLAGPAPQPLAAVRLEYDAADDSLLATGMYGGDMLDRFFSKFGFQIALAHGDDDIRRVVTEVTPVWPINEYSRSGAC